MPAGAVPNQRGDLVLNELIRAAAKIGSQKGFRAMKFRIYESWYEFNCGFEQVLGGLERLKKFAIFRREFLKAY